MLTKNAWVVFTWLFFALGVADIVALNSITQDSIFTAENYSFHVVFKPLLMASAIFFLMKYLSHKNHHNWVLVAFLYSLLGNLMFMAHELNPLFLVSGLTAFFLVHWSYIIYFHRSANVKTSSNWTIHGLQIFVALFMVGLYIAMYPNLGGLWLPVMLYSIILTVMVVVAFSRFGRVNFSAFLYTSIGAVAFLISDCLFGYHRYIDTIPFASSLIAGSYCVAQYMILKGYVSLKTEHPN